MWLKGGENTSSRERAPPAILTLYLSRTDLVLVVLLIELQMLKMVLMINYAVFPSLEKASSTNSHNTLPSFSAIRSAGKQEATSHVLSADVPPILITYDVCTMIIILSAIIINLSR